MAQVIADGRDVDFVLHEQLGIAELSKSDRFAEFDKKTIDLVLSEARNLAIKEILPTFQDGDREGCKFENGKVRVPNSFKRAYELFTKGEWLAITESTEYGGQGMPKSLGIAVNSYFNGANYSLMVYTVLTHGAGVLVDSFGTERQKKLFLKNLFTGRWTGTMLLTEPEAGSDVGNLTTTAVKRDDGSYSITGNKIFISAGEHDLADNIVHPVLARIEGSPEGTKGISLFLVPKYRVKEDGTLGGFNDIVCTGIEEKMGIHGSSTCSLTLGSKGECVGELLGEENKGMKMMFLMMNDARLMVGTQALCCASASYLNAVNYARKRIQGKNINDVASKKIGSILVPIIQHPDVRRMLITMKSYMEGMRSLLYYTTYLYDKIAISENEESRIKYQGLIDLLIPICKGYVTDRSFDLCSLGVQVYGGYGYIKDYPQEQYLRDCRITMLYEGTNGIQAIDFLGRKLGLNKGKVFLNLMGEVQTTIAKAKQIDEISSYASKLDQALNRLGETAMQIAGQAMSSEISTAFSFAHPFMEVSGDVVVAWMLLWRASIAAEKLNKGVKKKDTPFYEGQLKSMKFFISAILPVTIGKMEAINNFTDTITNISEDSFGGK